MVKITINCDMGEAFGIYRFGDDEACMPFITHANVACGFHASDPVVMRETVRAANRSACTATRRTLSRSQKPFTKHFRASSSLATRFSPPRSGRDAPG